MFEVIRSGPLTTVQDLGRSGYQKFGLPISGALDYYAHRMANILVGNDEQAATLEINLLGLQLQVLKDVVIAITGADLNAHINDDVAPMWKSFLVKEGDIIHFKGTISGCRAYLAVAGGIDVEKKLGSRATDMIGRIGGINGSEVRPGDRIKVLPSLKPFNQIRNRRIPKDLIPQYSSEVVVRVILGPQEHAFTKEGIQTFFASEYTVSTDSDRMACRLEGPKIEHQTQADILSEGLFSGAIQVPKNGLPILFQGGRPSVGGYTKLGGVITVDLPKVAQLKARDKIRFEKIELKKAQELLIEEMKALHFLSKIS